MNTTVPNDVRLPDRDQSKIRLLDVLVHLLAYVQRFSETPSGTAEELSLRLNRMISDARITALNSGYSMEVFGGALFPVLAWIDECVSLLHAWNGAHAWQDFLLQRVYFSTTLAGVEFFDRLGTLDEEADQIREVYLICLCLGFRGKYNTQPSAADLADIKMNQYAMYRGQSDKGLERFDELLFPCGYQRHADPLPVYVSHWKKWINLRSLLIVGVPILIIILMLLTFEQMLGDSVEAFRRETQL